MIGGETPTPYTPTAPPAGMESPAFRPFFIMDPGGSADNIDANAIAREYAADFAVSFSVALTRVLDWIKLLRGAEALAILQGTPGSVDYWNPADVQGPEWVPVPVSSIVAPPAYVTSPHPAPVSTVPAAVVSSPPGPTVSPAPGPGPRANAPGTTYSGSFSLSPLAILGLAVGAVLLLGRR